MPYQVFSTASSECPMGSRRTHENPRLLSSVAREMAFAKLMRSAEFSAWQELDDIAPYTGEA